MQNNQTLGTNELDATLVLSTGTKSPESLLSKQEEEQINIPAFADRYQFICKFAAGGVGVISKAKDVVFDRVVAVKNLNDKLKNEPSAVASFIRESRLNAKLDHPSIVPVYAMGRGKEGDWECVMKLINGTSLYHFIQKIRDRYSSRRIRQTQEQHALVSRLEYFVKICEAVEYCHSMKVIHGDIKPDNILMGKFGEVYLMDWGCAQETGSRPEHISGTPNFLPPEYLRDKLFTPQIDVFSLGMVLFEMVTLRPGKQKCTEGQNGDCSCCLIFEPKKYMHYDPRLRISERIQAIIRKAINPDPQKRYKTVNELTSDVRHFIFDEEISALPDTLLQKTFRVLYRNRMRTLLVASSLIVLVVAGFFYSYYTSTMMERHLTADLVRRIRLQSYTNILAGAVEKKFLEAQARLSMFGDNLIEAMRRPEKNNSVFYDNECFRKPETSPPGMVRSPNYKNPVNLQYMQRTIPAERWMPDLNLIKPLVFVDICKKVLNYNPGTIARSSKDGVAALLTDSVIQRLMVHWANNVRYSYPGTYENPREAASKYHWEDDYTAVGTKRLYWTLPYTCATGAYRIICKYPMFGRNHVFLGIAALELRLPNILSSLLRANSADPVHELFLVTNSDDAIAIRNGKLILVCDENRNLCGMTRETLQKVLKVLKKNHLEQVEMNVNGIPHYVSAAAIPAVDGILVQMISVEAMKNHNHVLVL